MTIRYVDLENGNDANDGSTFALRKKTIASATTGLTGADTVRVMASPAAASIGQNATWTNGSATVALTSAITQTIADCESAWTGATNVTASLATAYNRQGTYSAQLAIGTAFTTGLVGYFPLGSALDLSAYEQVSFWIRCTGTKSAGTFTLELCSDTAGATPVHSIPVPALTRNEWCPVVFDNAAALGASIQSVALYAAVDPGSVTVNIDNIFASKGKASGDSLTLYSLIRKGSSEDEPWHCIESVSGTTIILGSGYWGSNTAVSAKYQGATGSDALYRREPIVLSAAESVSASGSVSSPLNIEFGWDRTDMSTQTDVTWLRSVETSSGAGLTTNARAYVHLNRLYCSGGKYDVVALQRGF